jgi:hypothetical protein
MKKFYSILFSLIFISLINQETSACVEYHPDTVYVQVVCDSLCNIEIRVLNLQLGGGNPNQFCSCGISEALGTGIELEYIAFLDSLTGLPIEGFDPWSLVSAAGDSWADVDPNTFDWSGFVSDVNSSGLLLGQSVILSIRGNNTTGYCDVSDPGLFQEFFYGLGFGTDEWDDDNNELAESHNDITMFYDIPQENITGLYTTPDYFTALDQLLVGVKSDYEIAEVSLYPLPAENELNIVLPRGSANFTVHSLTGAIVDQAFNQASKTTLDVSGYPTGLYFIRVENEDSVITQKFVKL